MCLVRLVCAFNGRPIGVCKNHRAPFSETFIYPHVRLPTFWNPLVLVRVARGVIAMVVLRIENL